MNLFLEDSNSAGPDKLGFKIRSQNYYALCFKFLPNELSDIGSGAFCTFLREGCE